MVDETDYFANTEVLEPRKRRLSRLQNNRILKSICKHIQTSSQNWIVGKLSLMQSYRTKKIPRWFGNPQKDEVYMQVSLRLIPGKTAQDAPVPGLNGIEVYYRFFKVLAVKNKPDPEKPTEEEATEQQVFESNKYISEVTEWTGSILRSSETARAFYQFISSIGRDKILRMLSRTQERNK